MIDHRRTYLLRFLHTMTLPQAEPDEKYTHLKYHITKIPITPIIAPTQSTKYINRNTKKLLIDKKLIWFVFFLFVFDRYRLKVKKTVWKT